MSWKEATMSNYPKAPIQVDNNLLIKLISKVEQLTNYVKNLETEKQKARSPYMSLKEVCAYTGYGKTWVYDNKDRLGFSKTGGKIRFKRVDIEMFMHETYSKPKSA